MPRPRPDGWPRWDQLALLVAAMVVVVLVVLGLLGPTTVQPVHKTVPTVGFSAPPRQPLVQRDR